MPATKLHFTITRGLRFLGFRGLCLDASGTPVIFNDGNTAEIIARRAPNKPSAFTLPVSFGESDGEIIIDPMSSEDTAELPLGQYQHTLIITDSEGESTGPHCEGTITILRTVKV